MMGRIRDMIHEEYLKHGTRPDGAMKLDKKDPELSGEKPPEPIKIKRPRTIGNVFTAIEAQRAYNPNIPSIPSPQPAPANTFQKGVTPALDNSGPWGSAQPKGER